MAGADFRVTRLVFHYEGFDAVRKSPEVAAMVDGAAERIASAARSQGGEYEVQVSTTASRARAVVVTADVEAMRQEAENRALTRSLDAGQG